LAKDIDKSKVAHFLWPTVYIRELPLHCNVTTW